MPPSGEVSDISLGHLALFLSVCSEPDHALTDDERAAMPDAHELWHSLALDQRRRVDEYMSEMESR